MEPTNEPTTKQECNGICIGVCSRVHSGDKYVVERKLYEPCLVLNDVRSNGVKCTTARRSLDNGV
eukprot:757579-Lingulodinium_polyedra.AAC.1